VVDQHGLPRSKSLSPDGAIAAMSNGLYALDEHTVLMPE